MRNALIVNCMMRVLTEAKLVRDCRYKTNIQTFSVIQKIRYVGGIFRFEIFKFVHKIFMSSALHKKFLVLLSVVFFLFSYTIYADSYKIKTRCHSTFE